MLALVLLDLNHYCGLPFAKFQFVIGNFELPIFGFKAQFGSFGIDHDIHDLFGPHVN